jgi:tetratricopeptide (TPR) repeat protein
MGLALLPSAQKDVEVMKRVLKQPQFQVEPVLDLCDRPLQKMQETIELFFKQRASDDQIIFVYCGHTLQDADGRLYFAAPCTTLPVGGELVKAQLIPAATIQEAMNSSPARQQVVIVNSYCQQVSNQPAVAASKDALATALEGTGRVVLTAANVAQPVVTDAFDGWTYIRYFTEGIESGAADEGDKGLLTAAALHRYASKKLHVAAPSLETHLAGSAEMAEIPLLEVPQSNPQLHYRKVLEATPIATDAAGTPVLEGRSLLNDIRHRLELSPRDAALLEAQVLRPQQEYHQRLTMYRETVAESARSSDVPLEQRRQTWKQLQQALYLKDQDVAMITIAPSFALQQHQHAQYQGNLAHYQQVLLGAMQRQFPLQERDRAMLHRLQQTLHLGNEDVQALEDQLTAQAKQFVADDDRTNVEPEVEAAAPSSTQPVSQPNPAQVPEGTRFNHQPPLPLAETPSPEPPASLPPDDSRAKEAVMQRLFNLNEPNPLPSEPLPTPVPPPSPITTVQEAPSPIQPSAQPNFMDRIRRSTSNYQALIVPGILLAAILGILAAIMPFSNRPNWFKFGQQTPVDLAAAQQLNSAGLLKAQRGYTKEAIADYTQAIEKNPNDVSAYTNRGAAYHRLGDTSAAIGDYEQALKLTPQTAEQTALLHSNLSYAYYDRQNYDKALEEGNRAVALNGSFAQAHINLANARSKQGDYEGAIQDYNRAIALRPATAIQAGAYSNRGNAQFAQTRTKEAIRDYNQAIKLQPDYADAYYNLGLAQQSLNDRAAAINSFQTAARYYQTQGKEAQQKEAIDRANALQQNN